MKKRTFLALALIICLILPGAVFAAEQESLRGVYHIEAMPRCWNPMEKLTDADALLLSLTSDRLYMLCADGSELIPSLAAELPTDVTADYAGTYGIPADAKRGYAFLISLDPAAAWEDGDALDTEDLLFTLNLLIDAGRMEPVPANYHNYTHYMEKPTEDVISLAEAGFGSVEDAAAAGHTAFYVDVSHFWGLDAGWVPTSDASRIEDRAIPCGVTERYISARYLFSRYLRTGKPMSVFQRQFVGVSRNPEYVSREDIGLIPVSAQEFILITETPTTARTLAIQLADIVPLRPEFYGDDYATSPAAYSSCGPYRIVSMEENQILLERNPFWLGKVSAPDTDSIRLTTHIGA